MKRIALLVVLLSLLGLGGLFYLSRFFLNPDFVQHKIIQAIEDSTRGTFAYETFHITFFPEPGVVFEDITLQGIAEQDLDLAAKKFKIRMNLLGMLIGRPFASKVVIEQGQVEMVSPYDVWKEPIEIGNFRLSIRPFREKHPMRVRFEGDLAGLPKVFSGECTMTAERFGVWDWKALQMEGAIQLRWLHLVEWVEQLKLSLPIEIVKGQVTSNMKFTKTAGDEWLHWMSSLQLRDFVYQARSEGSLLTSSDIQGELKLDLAWNPITEELRMEESRMISPMGVLELAGALFLGTGEIQEMRLTSRGVMLESIPQYWIPLKEAIPFNIGFSGPVNMEATFEGRLDHLSIHANGDFKDAILTYGRYFSKPKELPLQLTLDFLLKESKVLSGDFSLKFQDANVKGTLSDVKLKGGEGQINILTNKFQLAGWESLLPLFSHYRLQGELKVLANWNGHLKDLGESLSMMNITLENGYLARSDAPAIKIPSLAVDYGPMALVVKDFKAVIAEAPIRAQGQMYNMFDNPFAEIKITSERIEPLKVLNQLENWLTEWQIRSDTSPYKDIRYWVQRYFPAGESLGDLSANLKIKDQSWLIEDIRFNAYEGSASIKGKIAPVSAKTRYGVDLKIDHLNMARFLNRGSQAVSPLEGNLFVNMRFEGEADPAQDWVNELQGKGVLTMTKGSFTRIDLLQTIGNIQELKEIGQYASGGTPFDNLQTEFVLKGNKLLTEKVTVLSPDLTVEASGETALTGSANYRLNVFLSPFFTEEYIGPMLGSVETVQGKQFGPVPLLLTGSFRNPELQPDPELVPRLVDRLLRRKHQKVLRNFLPEDALFESRSNV